MKNDNLITFFVRVQPNAKREEVQGFWNGTHLKITLKAPAVDGKANEALIGFLSETLKIKKSSIFIMTGETSRCKMVGIKTDNETKKGEVMSWLKQKS